MLVVVVALVELQEMVVQVEEEMPLLMALVEMDPQILAGVEVVLEEPPMDLVAPVVPVS
jgi:hypothetical protein